MAKPDEPPVERSGWRVVQQWRAGGIWQARQDDYPDQREAWKQFHAARESVVRRGSDGQVDLYDVARGQVLETARAGVPHLLEADKVILTPAELRLRLRSLFPRPEPTNQASEGEPA